MRLSLQFFHPEKGRIQLEQSNDDLQASAFWKTEDTDCFLHHRIMAAGWCSDAGRGCLMIPNCLHCMACVSPLYQHSVYLIFILIHIFVPPCIFMYPYVWILYVFHSDVPNAGHTGKLPNESECIFGRRVSNRNCSCIFGRRHDR